ncbi:flagellar hook-basal body complex protein FliE [Bacillus sp. mrc49]|uniref:Flagellar hook-basal body complex protein FliE n=1 Tax=Peribacillus simplex TaxID=1478 RepID=A0A109MRN9_9BACI|nr:flagellar hook-basal body complex protein FliE [Peribacillus simplex]KWW10914.1 flagellar hook-basal body protein FliE [Peribacillus simplex]PJN87139.1 flagellar hook-basal body complex protein FliE [Bacillus sp. mrc49]
MESVDVEGISLSPVSNAGNVLKKEQSKINTPYEAQQNFASVLKESMNKVNETQVASDDLTTKLVNGEDVELHSVMIASQKASITMQATLEVRNKVVEAYQEMMRMSI